MSMAYTVKIRNASGDTLQLYPSEDYLLTSITGITPALAVINATEMATMDGSRFNSSHVSFRNIVITFKIRGQGADVRARRVNLYKYIHPKHPVRVYIANDQRDVYIDGYVESLDDAGSIFSDNELLQVSVICPDPYFRDNTEVEAENTFGSNTSLFYFPFGILQGSPIPFSRKIIQQHHTIINEGDAACGITLQVAASGAVTNPTFYNESNGQTMTFELTMQAGDELIISTVQGQKSAKRIREGVETNIINTMTHGSAWLQLEPGDNVIYYSAASGTAAMTLTFLYTILYEGI